MMHDGRKRQHARGEQRAAGAAAARHQFQRGRAEDDSQENRSNDQIGQPQDFARHQHRRNADVMHAGDAAADDSPARGRAPSRLAIQRDRHAKRGDGDGDNER